MKYKVMDGPTEGTEIDYKETQLGFSLITRRPQKFNVVRSADLFDCLGKGERARVLWNMGLEDEAAKLLDEHQKETTIELIHKKSGELWVK